MTNVVNEISWSPLHGYEPWRDRGPFAGAEDRLPPEWTPAPRAARRGADNRELSRELLPQAHIRSVLGLILETTTGRRPRGQLQGLVSAQLYRRLRRRPPVPELRFALRTVHGFPVPPSAYEVWGTAQAGPRMYALTARFEITATGWRCTAFDLIRHGT